MAACGAISSSSLDRDLRLAHNLAPLQALALDVLRQLIARARRRIQTVFRELRNDLRIVQDFRELTIPEIEQILGSLPGRDERVPVDRLEAGVAGLCNRRDAGHHGRA